MADLEGLLARLTPAQKALFTAGRDMWTVAGVPELGIPDVSVTDGPNGARGAALLGAGRVSALCVPCGTALGATWDVELVQRVGEVLGEEARTKSARVLLAPTVNLVRSPLAGRTFECWSEDPLVTGVLATAFVRGVQSRGVAATVKHYVGNEAEWERTTVDSRLDERTLRELYLVPFEHAAREAWAVMTSYNRVNGSWVSESGELLRVLREDLGFDGVVMTDWFAVGSTQASGEAGLDLQMPGPARFFGTEDVPDLDAKARRWLTLVDRVGAWDDVPQPERAVELPEHRAVARRAASDATVLLSNDGVLPLTQGLSIALVGPNADRAHLMGGGSAALRPHRQPTIADALRDRVAEVVVEPGCVIDKTVQPLPCAMTTTFRDADGADVGTTVEPGGRLLWFDAPLEGLDPDRFSFTATGTLEVRHTGAHLLTLTQAGRARVLVDGVVVLDGVTDPPPPGEELFGLGSQEISALVDLVEGQRAEVVVEYSSEHAFLLHGVKVGHRPPESVDLMTRAVEAAAAADVAVVVVGTSDEWETEGHDRTDLRLPGAQDELVRRVCAVNPRTVVVVNAGTAVQLDWADLPAAVLQCWLGGQEMGEAVVDVLLGDAEPAGRLPVTVPLRVEHTPSYGAFPGENDGVDYREGLLVGYRWYTSRHLPVRFPFGNGLSYTTFRCGPARVADDAVEVDVTNTGSRRGAEVVQLYVEPPGGALFRPRRELRGFAKLWLEPGETATARIALTDRSFACWDPGSPQHQHLRERLGDGSVVPADRGPTPAATAGWRVPGGRYRLLLARSADDVVTEAWTDQEARDILPS